MTKDKDITLIIETTQGRWEHDFAKTDKVEQVIQAVIAQFGFAPDGNYELRLKTDPDEVLKPERPLTSYHLEEGTVLVFTDLGVAV